MIKSYKDLKVYKLSYSLALDLFWMTKEFPKEERYSLADQMLRASRSIPANIAEGWAKRYYENVFKQHLIDSIGSCEETKVWIDFAYDCKYISKEKNKSLIESYEEIGRMLTGLFENWKTYNK
ncbi:MAG: four helix bundle protein [bacterium]|nr:four helix bundle protein [bacterium]